MREVITRSEWPKSTKLNGTTFRKQILKFGKFRHPNPKFFKDKDAEWEFGSKEADEIIENFNKGFVESVNFIAYHDEEQASPHGRVIELIKAKDGVDAIIDVEDAKKLAELEASMGNGRTLGDGVSAGLDEKFRIPDADSKDKFVKGAVLRHVAATSIPFMQKMRDWEKIPADSFNFGHENYDGDPLVPIEESEDMDEKELLAALAKLTGKSEKDLSTAITAIESKKDEDKSDVEKKLEKLLAALEPDDDDKDKNKKKKEEDDDDKDVMGDIDKILSEKLGPVVETLKEFANNIGEMTEAAETSKKASAKVAADAAVKELTTAGKIVPTEVERWTKLYSNDPELFEEMAKDLEVKVNFEDPDEVNIVDNPYGKKLSSEQVSEEADRYLKELSTSRGKGTLSKGDKISVGKD